MKKIFLSFIIVSLVLIGCVSTQSGSIGFISTETYEAFEEVVKEVNTIVAERLFYSDDGINLSNINSFKGQNEMPGLCGDYVMEFLFYWNEVLNYDEVFGRAYRAMNGWSDTNDVFFEDMRFLSKETFNFRKDNWNSSVRRNNNNMVESDSIYHDGVSIKTVWRGKNFLSYNIYNENHSWVVINFNGDWYSCDPTAFDTNNTIDHIYWYPYKITLN